MEYGTRSRAEHNIIWAIIFMIVTALIGFVSYSFWTSAFVSTPVTIGPKTFYADVANTDELRKIGLVGRNTLDEDQALLLMYDREDVWPVRTKGLKYPIDIVWINSMKKVVYIARKAQPSTVNVYKPHGKSRYILQLTAGSIDKYNILPGKTVGFEVEA